jgi:hypothetical protein
VRTFIVIILFATTGLAAVLGLSRWPSRAPVELKLVSATPIGSVNGKEFMLLTLTISNRDSHSIVFNPVEDIEAKVGGRWIGVDQEFRGQLIAAGRKIQKSLFLPGGAKECRLRFRFHSWNHQSDTWMSQLLRRLGPKAVRFVAKSQLLGKWVWPDEWNTGWKEVTLAVTIPPSAGAPDRLSPLPHYHMVGPS